MTTRKHFMISLGKRIKAARITVGLTQEQIAEAIGVTRGTVAKYELGDAEPKLQKLSVIADVLHVTTDYLIGRDSTQNILSNKITEKAAKTLDAFISEIRKR